MALRILVVDDASFIRDMMKKHLREGIAGVEVVEALDGHRALAALKNQTVDLILSDWEMPNMGGDELLAALRGQPEGGDIPFVMVTSRGDRGHVVKAVEAGANDYLVKPFTPEELLRKVNKQLARVGKIPAAEAHAAARGVAAHSVNVLTGGRSADKPSSAARESAGAPPKKVKARAQLRFANRGEATHCVVRELSLQALTGLISRSETLPSLFDPVVVDIELEAEDGPARLNGYVHSVQAAENDPQTQIVKLVIRFVDQDATKYEALSRYIARM